MLSKEQHQTVTGPVNRVAALEAMVGKVEPIESTRKPPSQRPAVRAA